MEINNKLSFYFFALTAQGKGVSGGDRIFIEFARHWSKKNPIKIFVSYEGYFMCKRLFLSGKNIKYKILNVEKRWGSNFFLSYFARIIEGIKLGLNSKVINSESTIVYSTSHFWMDFIPGLLLKIRFKKIKWVVGWYQTAPNPLKGFAEGEREQKFRVLALVHWLIQLPLGPIIKRYSDFIFVNNQDEEKQFKGAKGEIVVVLGAVDLEKIENWKRITRSAVKIGKLPKVYDAVFQGRFHPQKGVVELIDIWQNVVEKKPEARLAMIGDGPLMQNVKLKIKNLKLQQNIQLFGYLFDGPEKYKIFSQSKIVVHPAFYDSGGMAAAEAMAFGLPAVGFNLKSFKSYYPKGMVKVEVGNLEGFAERIIEFLNEEKYRDKVGKEALKMIEMNWSWGKRANEVLYNILHELK